MNRSFVWQTIVRVQAERGATAQASIDYADAIAKAFDERFPPREERDEVEHRLREDLAEPKPRYSAVGRSVLDARRPGQHAAFVSERTATWAAEKLNAGETDYWEWTRGEPPT